MPLTETVWFVPFDSQDGALRSVYDADTVAPDAPGTIATGRPFTVSIQSMKLARQAHRSWFQKALHPDFDVLVLTSSALGSKPLVERIHYYKSEIDLDRPLLAHDLLADAVWVCDDYHDPDPFYVELQVVVVDRSDDTRHAALKGFETLAGTAGSIFPVALPYIALGDGVLEGLEKVIGASARREVHVISEPLKLFPPRTPRHKAMRPGQYVILGEEVDGAQYYLGANGELANRAGEEPVGGDGAPLSYAVLRIDTVQAVQTNFVVSQRVATLLTQMKNDREAQPAGVLQTSFGFLTDTLKAYTNFTDLQRYDQLRQKESHTPGEDDQMAQLAKRPELAPFLPGNVANQGAGGAQPSGSHQGQ